MAMILKPTDRMAERLEIARQDSDRAYWEAALLYGELTLKLIVAGMLSAVQDERDRHRYRFLHRLVRADGVGEWAQSLQDLLTGPSAQHFVADAQTDRQELVSRLATPTWQHESFALLDECAKGVNAWQDSAGPKVNLLMWCQVFAAIRNKTRGHGAQHTAQLAPHAPKLAQSVALLAVNLSLFKRPWVYLQQSLSGRYRLTQLSAQQIPGDPLATGSTTTHENGVYVWFGSPCRVHLLASDPDARDFFLPNGGFNDRTFELLSYNTGDTIPGDSAPYLTPASELPPSETASVGSLDVVGETWSNIPHPPRDYISRKEPERDLYNHIAHPRHSIITLRGRGGTGKTTLALHVLHQVAASGKYGVIVWFSSRDIDLLESGPKTVKADVITKKDVAAEFTKLTRPDKVTDKTWNPIAYFESELTKATLADDKPTLYVFDNFETMQNPVELYHWIDTHLREPNKVVITTRRREFEGDHQIDFDRGMSQVEAEELIRVTAGHLGITGVLTREYCEELISESLGHPYVMKVLLGEVAKTRELRKVERIVADKDQMLNALFERTYACLSAPAQRIFLTLCAWRSMVPRLALEAVVLRPANRDRIDVDRALDELRLSSLLEVVESDADQEHFMSVPLVASLFGLTKRETSSAWSAVMADVHILQMFGACHESTIRHGIEPRIAFLFKGVALLAAERKAAIEEFYPVMEYIARRTAKAWLMLAQLHEERDAFDDLKKARNCANRFIETSPSSHDAVRAWSMVLEYAWRMRDYPEVVRAAAAMAKIPGVPFQTLSSNAHRVNQVFGTSAGWMRTPEDRAAVVQVVKTMEVRLAEGGASDCSRLAWLHLHMHDLAGAMRAVEMGLIRDNRNEHCRKLRDRLTRKEQILRRKQAGQGNQPAQNREKSRLSPGPRPRW